MGQANEGFGEKGDKNILFCETQENKDLSSAYILYCFLKRKTSQKSVKFPDDYESYMKGEVKKNKKIEKNKNKLKPPKTIKEKRKEKKKEEKFLFYKVENYFLWLR